MRYIIIGAGAVGGTIGGRLFDSGREVVLVARGAHAQALRERGLRLELPDGTHELPVPVVDGPDDVTARDDDVLVLAVKTQDTADALARWSGHGDRPAVVCAQNGVENERLALRRFRDVHAMCVWLPSSYLEPGVVAAPCAPLTGILHLGRYPSGADDTTRRIAADLADSGFAAPVRDDVMAWKYAKLLANLGNAVDALFGSVGGGPPAELAERAGAEGAAVLDAAGIPFVGAAEAARERGDRMRIRPVNGPARGGGSSWQSLMRGTGSIESDYLNGEIVLLARRLGVPAPVNEALQRTANLFARERRRPGDLTAGERAALLASLREA
ncbi:MULTISPECIES: ketopantoate reductase family protein [unclassified Streptomyces]|uniref:ketopantoate reductase family protein n=1 Tax=unclassified Streptomyces TaxID=2593676 RepID=UPI000B88A680|nr:MULTISPECIES: 2-dehydropantoate 2-reductase N-terminal domain-containing protein [unclassified Streptomyces]MYS20114.1 NAD(P)-binding domain-containing protein [Streptomyces sp. SID4948]